MIDTTNLTNLISQFRSTTAANSVSPETVGSILQKITDTISSIGVEVDTDLLVQNIGDFDSEEDADTATLSVEINQTAKVRIILYRFKGTEVSGSQSWHSRLIVNAYRAATNSAGSTIRYDVSQYKFDYDGGVYVRTITGVNWAESARGGSEEWVRVTLTADELADVAAIPTAQTTQSGTSANYVYSENISAHQCHAVVVAKYTAFQQEEGKLNLRFGLWGSASETNNYFTKVVPTATTSANGAMSSAVFSRLGTGATIYEGTCTSDAVVVSYPNWASGGNRTFSLGAATSARAGVMTAAMFTKLSELPTKAQYDTDFESVGIEIEDVETAAAAAQTKANSAYSLAEEAGDKAASNTSLISVVAQNLQSKIDALEERIAALEGE